MHLHCKSERQQVVMKCCTYICKSSERHIVHSLIWQVGLFSSQALACLTSYFIVPEIFFVRGEVKYDSWKHALSCQGDFVWFKVCNSNLCKQKRILTVIKIRWAPKGKRGRPKTTWRRTVERERQEAGWLEVDRGRRWEPQQAIEKSGKALWGPYVQQGIKRIGDGEDLL